MTLDTIAPHVELTADLQPTLFAGAGHEAALPYEVGERGVLLSLQIRRWSDTQGPTGKVLAAISAGKAKKLVGSATWNGCGAGASILRTGKYSLVLRATDSAGNTGASAPLAATLFAPATVRGKVLDEKGRPVGGARVIALPARLECTTGPDGSFALRNCPLGRTVLKAGKRGYPVGGIGASIDLRPHTWTIVLGRGPNGQIVGRADEASSAPATRAPAAAPRGFWDDVGDAWDDAWDEADSWFEDVTIRMSGSFGYADRNNNGSTPMANVKIVLRDVWFDLVGGEWTRDIDEAETDANGSFDFTYTVTWDDVDWPDVRVCALAEDRWGTEARVETPTIIGETVYAQGELWNDNQSNRLDRFYTDHGDLRGAWRMLDAVRACRAAGFTRPQILVIFPDSNWPLEPGSGHYQNSGDRIRIFEGYQWGATFFHEYGHAWLHAAYDAGEDIAGIDCNAYDAYLDGPGPDTDEFWLEDGTFIGEKSDGEYSGFEVEEEGWTAFNEGWAEFFAGFMTGADYAGDSDELFECDRQHGGVNEAEVIHSVSRVLWDLCDSSSSQLVYSWAPSVPATIGPRLACHYGVGDDDRVDGPVGGRDVFAVVKQVIDDWWPSDVWDLRTHVRDGLAGNAAALRAVDAIYYRMGLPDEITQNRPHIDAGTVIVDGETNVDGSYRDTLRLWCRVTDADSPGGEWDMNHMGVRFEGRTGTAGGPLSDWNPMSWTLTRSATPPPGQSGTDWFRVDFDTLAESPVALRPDHAAGVFVRNSNRKANTVTAETTGGTMRRDRFQVRAFAFDGLQESEPVESAEFVVDNSHGAGYQYARASALDSYIRWPAGVGISHTNATYELWYRPDANAWGTILAITYADTGGRYPVMELCRNMFGEAFFSLNQAGPSPGSGTEHFITGTTVMQPGRWYHLAAQHGSAGMELFVNGIREATDSYTGGPQPDGGSPSDGAFSLGQFGDWLANSALGDYEEVRVSSVRRHTGNFTPSMVPFAGDASTSILDHLDGSTNGTNSGFTFGP